MTLKPTAQGNLQKTPFAHLVLYMFGRKLSGTLAVWPESTESEDRSQDRVLFREGSIVAVRLRSAQADAYACLVALFARADGPYGFYADQNLLGTGELTRSLRVDSYTLLSAGLRAHPRPTVIDPVLARIGTRTIRMRPGVPLEKLELSQKESAIVDSLRAGPATLDDMLRATDLPATEVRRLFCLFALIRGIEATDGQAGLSPVSLDSMPPGREDAAPSEPPVSVPRPPRLPGTARPSQTGIAATRPSQSSPAVPPVPGAAPHSPTPPAAHAPGLRSSPPPSGELPLPAPALPAGLGMEDKTRWLELAAAYDTMDQRTHFELLGIAEAATEREIQNAYFALVKRFHPDRLPAALAPLTRCAQLLFERITEANETLSNGELRSQYVSSVRDGGGTRAAERMLRDVVESALEFQKAEVLIRRREYAQALQMLANAILRNPTESDYHGLRGWLLHLMNPGENAPTDEMLRDFERALKLNPRNERAHYYKGVVLKRLGRDSEALRHFKQAAELNPRNVDAARELRLATMRRHSKAPAPPPAGGLLSKLFRGPNKEKS